MDKDFLRKAILTVYKTSIIEENEIMKNKTLAMLNNESFTIDDIAQIKFELEGIDEKYKQKEYICYIDGAVDSQSEKTSAASAFVIYLNEDVFYKFKYEIPNELTINNITQNTSSHIAEYQSLIILLRTLKNKIINPSRATIKVYTDSDVLKGQFYAEYRVSNEIQKELRKEVFSLVKSFYDVQLEWIPREENILANNLAQELI